MADPPSDAPPPRLVCADCGERVVQGRAPGTFTHVSRLVAACDLDSDHPARPDWPRAGALTCRVCGASVAYVDGAFGHTDAARDADHPPVPALPVV